MNLGRQLRRIRKEKGMSQEDFAEIFCVTRQTVSNWENSRSYPDLETLVRISDRFGVSLDIMLKGDEEMIKKMDKSVMDGAKYRKVLRIAVRVLAAAALVFCIYAAKYRSVKKELETRFYGTIEREGFEKDRDGYYRAKACGGTFRVPAQEMPPLADFDLDFNVSNLYFDMDTEEGHISGLWTGRDDFSFALEDKNNIVLGGSSDAGADTGRLARSLRLEKGRLEEIIGKGKQLYRRFYG